MPESAIYQDIFQECFQEGFALGVKQVAANLLREDFAVEVVARLTDLQLAEVETLRQALALENKG